MKADVILLEMHKKRAEELGITLQEYLLLEILTELEGK